MIPNNIYNLITVKNSIFGILGFVSTLISILQGPDAYLGFMKWWNSSGKNEENITLPLSHPYETWKKVSASDIPWLQGTWCYLGSAGGLTAKFRRNGNVVEKEDVATRGQWVSHDTYLSNMNVLRLRNAKTNISTFLTYDPNKPRSFLENTRRTESDGRVRAGDKFLAVDCRDCKNGRGQGTYDCRPSK